MNKEQSQPYTDPGCGIKIINAPGEVDLTAVISSACADSLRIAQELWGLKPPDDCRIYVMTSWRKFYDQAAPWYLKPFIYTSLPLWGPRAKRTWPYAGAWTQRLGRRVVIGIKPPRLLAVSNRSIGQMMYVDEKDMNVKMRHYICHELTHACALHLRLPAWLNEGIAMISVDRLLGRRTIREDTLVTLKADSPRCVPPDYRQLSVVDAKGVALHTLRGYWLANMLEEIEPGFQKRMFSSAANVQQMDLNIARLLGLPADQLWQQVDDRILAHFSR
jgi:hypothetical protein